MSRARLAILLSTAMLIASMAEADEEAGNLPHVQSDTYGRCYAKSLPDEFYGEAGETRIYQVERGADLLLDRYDWFAQQIYLQCNMTRDGDAGASIVRLGPWPRGQEATDDQLAIAFYFRGKLLRSYSTLDIAGAPDNVAASVSHYQVIADVPGYRWIDGNQYAFDIVTIDGRTLSFDPVTGDQLPTAP
jgi:hypothetical protein